jgi:hypothetical protein
MIRSPALYRLTPATTTFFLCDIQERFRDLIHQYPSVIATAEKMVKASTILDIPVVSTEQNPRALGSLVSELRASSFKINCLKSKFRYTHITARLYSHHL